MSGSTRNPRPGLYVGLGLALMVSAALQGAGLWLALGPRSRIDAAAIVAIAGGALACLIGAALAAAVLPRGRGPAQEAARAAAGDPRPRGAEDAAALAHSRKMEALGLLAGGVAHDFNNQLHVIRNALEILRRQDPQGDMRRHLEMIHRSADRAGALTARLLSFSRREPLELRPIDPNELVSQMAELLRQSLGERIVVETVLGRGVADVAADPGQLETAILNLAINARDAMSQAGLLTIETANVRLEESPRSYVMIAVSDNGTGMPPDVAARACEPFFTTKEPGRGTGLGLSQVTAFAEQSGGQVQISSAPGKGTTVRLYLPGSLPGGTACATARPGERTPVQDGRPATIARRPAWFIEEGAGAIPLVAAAGPER